MKLIGLALIFYMIDISTVESKGKYVEPCRFDSTFNVCFKGLLKSIIMLLSERHTELKIPSLDPMSTNDVSIDGNGLKLSLADIKVHGLRNCEISEFTFNFQDDTFSFSLKGNLSLLGKYIVDGKILVLPIQGHGDGIVKTVNIRVHLKGTLKEDNKGHLKITSPTYTYDIERTIFDFKNLFNGNKELSDATHQFANENWREIMDELAPPVVKEVALNYIKAFNKFFASVPLSDVIVDYKKIR